MRWTTVVKHFFPFGSGISSAGSRQLAKGLLCTLWLLLASQVWAVTSDHSDDDKDLVHVTVGILDVDAISSAEQSFTINVYLQFRWHDPALAHTGAETLRRNLSDIRAPRFLLMNRQKTWSSLLNVVDISPEGDAIYRMRLWGEFSQPLNLENFPFDDHDFEIAIVGIKPEGGHVRLVANETGPSFLGASFSVPDWRVTGSMEGERALDLTRDEQIPGFVFSFHAERIFNHYVIKYIIPLILIVGMSWIVFWIDPQESGSQLSVAVTAALTLIAYHIALASKLPDIPYLTRMDLFLFGSTLLVFSALLEVVITSRLANSGRVLWARRIDLVCRPLFPLTYLAIAEWSLGLANVGTAAVGLSHRI